MLFSLLFLSLIPVAFIAESFSDLPADDADEDDGYGTGTLPTGNGDFIAVDDTSDDGDAQDVLLPETGDQVIPGQGIGEPTDVLQPNDGLGDGASPDQDATLLDRLLGTETDAHYGREDLASFLGDQDEVLLSDEGDTVAMTDDGIDGTGEGRIDDHHGTPLVQSDNESAVDVIDAGAGDDIIIGGDAAAYLFGNDGDDTVTSGEGAIAAFGGAGDDLLDANLSLDGFLDGGVGNDKLIGGAGDDQLFGGQHEDDGLSADVATDDDELSGGRGNDELFGGYGSDVLRGGDGDDVINHLGHAMERSGAERHDFDWHIDGDKDQLDGGAGNDTLIMDRSDIATGGEGEDVFWVYSDNDAGEDHAEVTDFVPGQDFLRVSMDPDQDVEDLEYDVRPSATGEDGIVTVNGEVIAILKGAPGATIQDVFVEVTQEAFV